MRIYKERRVYYFACSKCGSKNRQSLKRSKAKAGICRKCRRVTINKDQLSLIEDILLPGDPKKLTGTAKPGDVIKLGYSYPLEEK